jgi:hypothetical protein
MLGLLGTLGVVAQMAALALGFSASVAMSFGLFACIAWLGHAMKQRDGWLFATNSLVAGFATWGLI